MRALSEFKPPQPNRALIWLSQQLLPVYTNVVERLSFQIAEGPDHPLKFLKEKSVVVVINHGDRQDPLVVVALAKYMHETFYCLVAREVFDWYHGMLGWLFQKLGCYSVNRGVADFRSIHTTHQILAHSHRKLVVFPEAEITGDEELVHKLNPSFIHLLLESQEDICKTDPKHSIWVLPVGVSYRLQTSLEKSVSRLLNRIERRLRIKKSDKNEIKTRVLAAVDKVIQNLSKHYECPIFEEHPRQEQVRQLTRNICDRIADSAAVKCDPLKTEELLMYFLRNHLVKALAGGKRRTAPDEQCLSRSKVRSYREFLKDLDRVERLLILHRVLEHSSSPIQICRILDFLEAETLGRMTKKGSQCASIYIGKPIEVLPYLQSYQSSKDNAIDNLMTSVRQGLQNALNSSHQVSISLTDHNLHCKVHST